MTISEVVPHFTFWWAQAGHPHWPGEAHAGYWHAVFGGCYLPLLRRRFKHSVIDAERSSNYSSGFTVWDLLHGTARLDVHQQAIVVGLPDLRDRSQVTLARTLVMPGEGPGAVL